MALAFAYFWEFCVSRTRMGVFYQQRSGLIFAFHHSHRCLFTTQFGVHWFASGKRHHAQIITICHDVEKTKRTLSKHIERPRLVRATKPWGPVTVFGSFPGFSFSSGCRRAGYYTLAKARRRCSLRGESLGLHCDGDIQIRGNGKSATMSSNTFCCRLWV
ncbi:uncharacterized protein B0I36DRAFT_29319 [Microdochium trichocladiopsis]|uniref:Uncharacterized protein n=1 Tax=Microdochium trichocladiopsis TaxID=1682393 RepID=A0A9P8XY37_9PEZI|nr:uncharacterized protein B0I36DRAFT_29319 [Microdochium trichocladiopsis]KAH7021135.1 hypothetical protein B0I36DRAFT_29319 [Microdochium trichocladiopsis]